MSIDIKHLAQLSRLSISESEEKQLQNQMKSIIDMVENLPDLKSSDSLLDKNNPMICRKDVAENNYKRDELLKNAPKIKAGCVVVPKIIEE